MTTAGGESLVPSQIQDDVIDALYTLTLEIGEASPTRLKELATNLRDILKSSLNTDKRKTLAASCLPKMFRYFDAAQRAHPEDEELYKEVQALIFERISDFLEDSDLTFNTCLNNIQELYKAKDDTIMFATFAWVGQLIAQLVVLRPRDTRVERVLSRLMSQNPSVTAQCLLMRVAEEQSAEGVDHVMDMLKKYSNEISKVATVRPTGEEGEAATIRQTIVAVLNRVIANNDAPLTLLRRLAGLAGQYGAPAAELLPLLSRMNVPVGRRQALALGVVDYVARAAKGPEATAVKEAGAAAVSELTDEVLVMLSGASSQASVVALTQLLVIISEIFAAGKDEANCGRVSTAALQAVQRAIPATPETEAATLEDAAPAEDSLPTGEVDWSLLEAALTALSIYGNDANDILIEGGLLPRQGMAPDAVPTDSAGNRLTLRNRLAFALHLARITRARLQHKRSELQTAENEARKEANEAAKAAGTVAPPRAPNALVAEIGVGIQCLQAVIQQLENVLVRNKLDLSGPFSWRERRGGGRGEGGRGGGEGGRGGRGGRGPQQQPQKRGRSPGADRAGLQGVSLGEKRVPQQKGRGGGPGGRGNSNAGRATNNAPGGRGGRGGRGRR